MMPSTEELNKYLMKKGREGGRKEGKDRGMEGGRKKRGVLFFPPPALFRGTSKEKAILSIHRPLHCSGLDKDWCLVF